MKQTKKNKKNKKKKLQIELEEITYKAMEKQWLMLKKTNNRGVTSRTELDV